MLRGSGEGKEKKLKRYRRVYAGRDGRVTKTCEVGATSAKRTKGGGQAKTSIV